MVFFSLLPYTTIFDAILGLTQKRTLATVAHAKAHSGGWGLRKSALWLRPSRKSALCDPQVPQTALFRYVAASGKCGATARQIAGHYGKWLNWANALEQPPASLRGGLRQGPQRSVWSLTSRKGAV